MRVVHVAAVVATAAFLSACGGGSSGSSPTTNGAVPPTNTGAGSTGNGNNASPAPSIQVHVTEIPIPTIAGASPSTLAVSDTGAVYFGAGGNVSGDGLYEYNGTGTFIHTVAYSVDPNCAQDVQGLLCNVGTVDAIDASGLPRVLWASAYQETFETFAFDLPQYGGSGGTASKPPDSVIPSNTCCFPFFTSSMITSRSGKVWVGGQDQPGNAFAEGIPVGQLLNYIGTLFLTNGPNNNVWGGVGFSSTPAILEFSQTGSILHAFPLASGTQLYGIVGNSGDFLWFTDQGHNAIGRISKQGTVNDYPIPTPNSAPLGITLAADGAVWFTESNALPGKVGRIDSAGHLQEFSLPSDFGPPGPIVANPAGCNAPNVVWIGQVTGVRDPKIAKLTYQ